VAPIADSFNHHPKSENEIDIVNKKLHQQAIFAKDDTILKYLHNFDWKAYDDNETVKKLDTKKSKLRYDVSRLIPGSGFLKIQEAAAEDYDPDFNDEQDDDELEHEENAEVSGRLEELRRLILSQKELSKSEFEEVAENYRLREVYHYRSWFKDEDPDNYFVFYNGSKEII
jgi:hypothetical protein